MLVLETPLPVWRKVSDVAIAFAVVGVVMSTGSACGELFRHIAGDYIQQLDPKNYFLISSVTYACSLLATLIIMKLFARKAFSYWGLNFTEAKFSLKAFFWFSLIYPPLIYFALVVDEAKAIVAAGDSIDAIGIAGALSNHLFINSIYQEALFRGFLMVFLSRSWPGVWRVGTLEIPYTAGWATLIFILAHIQPEQPLLFHPWQVGWSLVLGIYYAIIFHKTKSLLNPILSHSYSNAAYVVLLLIESSGI